MDYNRPIMLETSNPIARRRLILISIILATIPCYCLGGIAVMLAPDSSVTATPTEMPILATATQPLQIPTSSPGPAIISATPSNTPTITPSPTNTSTPTFTPSITATWTATYTLTASLTFTPSYTPSLTFTPTETFTPTPSFTPVTPSNTPTPTITSFPNP